MNTISTPRTPQTNLARPMLCAQHARPPCMIVERSHCAECRRLLQEIAEWTSVEAVSS